MKTPKEIDHLKIKWRDDPCWDIENTPGFEDHRNELLNFRLIYEQRWEDAREKRLRSLADKLGCPGNIPLARYIERLEDRIKTLEDKQP